MWIESRKLQKQYRGNFSLSIPIRFKKLLKWNDNEIVFINCDYEKKELNLKGADTQQQTENERIIELVKKDDGSDNSNNQDNQDITTCSR